MRLPTFDERLTDFYEAPRPELWLSLRKGLLERGDFDPYAPEWEGLERLFREGDFLRLLSTSRELHPFGCLSPRFFYLVGMAALELGQMERAATARRQSRACLQAILDSGSGDEADPYLTTYPWDGYDVLQAFKLVALGQQLVDRNGVWCDVLTADDGQDYWFEVTDLIERRPNRANVCEPTATNHHVGRPS